MNNSSTNPDTCRRWICCATPDTISKTLSGFAETLQIVASWHTGPQRTTIQLEVSELKAASSVLNQQRRNNYVSRLDAATEFCEGLAGRIRNRGFLPKHIPAWVMDVQDWEEVPEAQRLRLFWEASILPN